MKIKSIFAVALMAAGVCFASCSKDEGAGGNSAEGKDFFIKITKPGPGSRAEGAEMTGQAITFKDGYLVFATGDNIGKVVKIVETLTVPAVEGEVTVAQLEAGATIGKIPATTNVVNLYGNLGNSLNGIAAKAVKDGKVSDIAALVYTLADIQNAANDVAKVPVFATGGVSLGAVTGNNERLEAELKVKAIASRLQIGKITCSDTRVTELKVAGVYINGFYHSMKGGSTFETAYLVDNSINPDNYPTTGYATYTTMSDIISPVVDLGPLNAEAKPKTLAYWAYNFFPSERMPHIVVHFTSITTDEGSDVNKYATVAKYSKVAGGGAGNEFTLAEAGYAYTLNIDISDYKKQIDEMPEENSDVTGYVSIEQINWKGQTLYPEW